MFRNIFGKSTTIYMEVANNFAEHPPASEALGSSDHRNLETDIELARGIAPDNGSIIWDPKPCGCAGDGPKCHECLASSKASVKVKMESWSIEKTVFLGIILGAFFVWAIVFGVCLNVYKL